MKSGISGGMHVLVAGTDEEAIIRVLSGHSNRQRQVIKDTYKTSFGRVCRHGLVSVSPVSPVSQGSRWWWWGVGGGGGEWEGEEEGGNWSDNYQRQLGHQG